MKQHSSSSEMIVETIITWLKTLWCCALALACAEMQMLISVPAWDKARSKVSADKLWLHNTEEVVVISGVIYVSAVFAVLLQSALYKYIEMSQFWDNSVSCWIMRQWETCLAVKAVDEMQMDTEYCLRRWNETVYTRVCSLGVVLVRTDG